MFSNTRRTYFKSASMKQAWTIGSTVKVGFLTLTVKGLKDTTTHRGHQIFVLESEKGIRYEFSAYEGISKAEG